MSGSNGKHSQVKVNELQVNCNNNSLRGSIGGYLVICKLEGISKEAVLA